MSLPREGMKFWFGMYPSITFADGKCHVIPGFGNTGLFETDEGLVIFDVPIKQSAQKTFNEIRGITKKQVKYLIYSHGHFDHAFGFGPFVHAADLAEIAVYSRGGIAVLDHEFTGTRQLVWLDVPGGAVTEGVDPFFELHVGAIVLSGKIGAAQFTECDFLALLDGRIISGKGCRQIDTVFGRCCWSFRHVGSP